MKIREASGARIELPNEDVASDVIRISGTKASAERARELIEFGLRELLVGCIFNFYRP